jgi:hypothetical protein
VLSFFLELAPLLLQEQCVHYAWWLTVQHFLRELIHPCQGFPYEFNLSLLLAKSLLSSSSSYLNVFFSNINILL